MNSREGDNDKITMCYNVRACYREVDRVHSQHRVIKFRNRFEFSPLAA